VRSPQPVLRPSPSKNMANKTQILAPSKRCQSSFEPLLSKRGVLFQPRENTRQARNVSRQANYSSNKMKDNKGRLLSKYFCKKFL
jgi:hypothetical protein